MINGFSMVLATFEQPLNDYTSAAVSRVLHDFYEIDPKLGFYGGGGLDARFGRTPISFALGAVPPGVPRWGKAYKNWLAETFSRSMYVACHATSLPVEANSFSLDPDLKDAWGLPALRMTYKDHPDDLKTVEVSCKTARWNCWRLPRRQRFGLRPCGSNPTPCICWEPAAWGTTRKPRW